MKYLFLYINFIICIINFSTFCKECEMEIYLKYNRSKAFFKKEIELKKKIYTKDELIDEINKKMDEDSKKKEEDLNKEIENLKKDREKNKEDIEKSYKKIDLLEDIVKWNKDCKINRFENIEPNYIFYNIYKIFDDKNIKDKYNFSPNIDSGIDLTNVNIIEFEYTIKNDKKYNIKYYEFDINTDNEIYKNYLTKNNLTLPELHDKLREEVEKLNNFINDKHVIIEYMDIFDIAKYLKLHHLTNLQDYIGSYESASGKCAGQRLNNMQDFGLCFKYEVKDIEIKVKRGDDEFTIKCPIGNMFRSVNDTLRRGISSYFDINEDDLDEDRPRTKEEINDPDFKKKAKKKVEDKFKEIIVSINGSEYNYDEFSTKMGDKKFFADGFSLSVNSNIKTRAEAAKEQEELERQQREIQQLKLKKQGKNCCSMCLNNCCCCCNNSIQR